VTAAVGLMKKWNLNRNPVYVTYNQEPIVLPQNIPENTVKNTKHLKSALHELRDERRA
jgi:hypothetical protein